MGRYAFFNTGLEYKFAFMIQDSSDIIMFGGRLTSRTNIEWSSADIPLIEQTLNNLYTYYSIIPYDDKGHNKSLDGTQTLRNDLRKHFDYCTADDAQIVYRILLGHLILHQLSYTPELVCSFET